MKGISFGVIFALIIGILVILLLSPALFKTVSGVILMLEEQTGLVKYSPIEQQIICYYYLCKYGCGSGQYEDWCGPSGKYNIEKVHDEICVLPDKLKVAGEQCKNAIGQFPIRIELDSDNELSKDRLKKRIDDSSELIIPTEKSEGMFYWSLLLNPHGLTMSIIDSLKDVLDRAKSIALLVKDSFLKDVNYEPTKFEGKVYEVKNLVKFAKVRKDIYYIYGMNSVFLTISEIPAYLNLSDGKKVTVKIGRDMGIKIIRISIEDEKEKNLESYNYLLKANSKRFSAKPPMLPSFNLEFWNTTNEQKIDYTCSEVLCMEKPKFTFNTRKGKVIVTVEGVDTQIVRQDIAEAEIVNFTLSIEYTYQECPSGMECLDVNICKQIGRCEPGYSCRYGCCCRIG
jgi:hypothetical protein